MILYKNKRKKGQILVITLLVLSVLAITIIGVVTVINRDTNLIQNTQLFEESYSVAESSLVELVKLTADTPDLLSRLNDPDIKSKYDCKNLPANSGVKKYECTQEINQTNPENMQEEKFAEITTIIEEKNLIEDLQIQKDQALTIGISNYTQNLQVSWEQADVALEVILVLKNNTTGEFFSVFDMYDGNSTKVFDSFQLLNPSDIKHDLSIYPGSNNQLSSIINIGESINKARNLTSRFPNIGSSEAIYLILTPRSKLVNEVTISAIPSSPATFPAQIVEYSSKGFIADNSPQATISSQVFKFNQIESIFNYALLTAGNI